MSWELHHHQKNYGHKKQLVDKFVYFFAILGPVGILPQVIKIWTEKNATGVSMITWIGYLVGGVFWVSYGLIHKEKPIILTNILIGILAAIILVGIFRYGS